MSKEFDHSVQLSEIELIWNFKPSDGFKTRFSKLDLSFRELSEDEKYTSILNVLKTLNSTVVKVGSHRNNDWEKGWAENLSDYDESGDISTILPKYFGKIPLIRWMQNWIEPHVSSMEYSLLGLLLEYIYEEKFTSFETIYEFGCGTGHNLLRAREIFPEKNLVGLDWAESSQKLISKISKDTGDIKLSSHNFDYFNPNYDISLKENSAVITVASLEQTGSNFKEFIHYLIEKKPQLVVHVEPVAELLDQNNLLDYLSIKYFEKRDYLNGLLDYLVELEKQKLIVIHETKRSQVGSFYIDGYSIIIWSPA